MFTIKRDLTNMALKISHIELNAKTTQCFNNDTKSLMNFSTPDIIHDWIVQKINSNQNINSSPE